MRLGQSRGVSFTALIVAEALLVAVIIFGGYIFFQRDMRHVENENYDQLAAIAQLKVREIEDWRHERIADCNVVARSPFVRQATRKLLENPADVESRRMLLERCETIKESFDYDDVFIYTTDDRLLLSTASTPPILDSANQKAIHQVIDTRESAFSDLFEIGTGTIYLDALSPIAAKGEKPEAILVYRSNADAYLFPFIQKWPTPSKSAETLLIKRVGDSILYLNELRHRPGTALKLTIPITRTDVPAVQAALGKTGRFDGADYRGIPVIADMLPVTGSDWSMIAKIDRTELLKDVTERGLLVGSIGLLLIIFTILSLGFYYRHRQFGLLNDALTSEREKARALGLFRATLYGIGDGVITTDATGCIIHMNPVAEELTGWEEGEATGKPLLEVFNIISEVTGGRAKNPVECVLATGRIEGLANHTLLISRDGNSRAIADSAAPIFDDEKEIVGTVMVFRDQTAEREARKELKESRDRLEMALTSAGMGVWENDLATGHRLMDRQTCEILGINPKTFKGTPEEFFQTLHPDDRPTVKDMLSRTIQESTPLIVASRVIWPDESVHYIRARGKLVCNDDGKPVKIVGIVWDVSDQKRAEEQLQMLGYSVDVNPDGAYWMDNENRFVYVNEAGCNALGYTREELIGRMFSTDINPGATPENMAGVWEILRTKGSFVGEGIHIRKDGTTFPVEIRSAYVQFGGKEYNCGFAHDLSELKRSRDDLIASEQLYRSLFENILNGFAYHRVILEGDVPVDYEFITVNETFGQLTGLQGVAGKRVSEVIPGIHQSDPELLKRYAHVAFTGESDRFEMYVASINGWYEVSTYSPQYGYFVTIIENITERKNAEDQLKASEERNRVLLENANDALYFYEIDDDLNPGNFKLVNDASVKMVGYSREELHEISMLDLAPEDLREGRRSILERLVNEYGICIETEHLAKDGRRIPVEVSARLILLGGKKGVLAVARDLIERKAAQQEHERMQQQLAQANKMEAIGKIVGGVSHDFNNMLQSILGSAELARDPDISFADRKKLMDDILSASERSAEVTKKLLGFARKQQIVPKVIDINEHIDLSHRILRRLIGEHIDFHWQPSTAIWPVKADPSQVEQVLMNLCVNARDAISGHGKIVIKTWNELVEDAAPFDDEDFNPGEYVALQVWDNGSGISADVMGKMFEPFYSTKEVGKGTGLGLPNVMGIVKQNEGLLKVETMLGEWTAFTVYLPRCYEELTPGKDAFAGPLPTGRETILLVEDEKSILYMIKSVLEKLGYRVDAFADPIEAIQVFERQSARYDILVTDLIMPGINGSELALRLREVRPDLPCIFCSGYSSDIPQIEEIRTSGIPYLQKPFTRSQLALTVREVLDSHPRKTVRTGFLEGK